MRTSRLWNLAFSLVLAVAVALSAPAPRAMAVSPGSVRAIFNNIPGTPAFSVHANATGWAQGDIHVSFKLYVGGTAQGPWTFIQSASNFCARSTHCSTSTYLGSCTDAWYKLVATAHGRGGDAENNPDTVKVHVLGPMIAKPERLAPGRSVASWCRNVYLPI